MFAINITQKMRAIVFLATCFGAIAVAYRPVIATTQLALHGAEYTQILLIFPLSIAFVWRGRKALAGMHTVSFRSGLFVLCVAGSIALLSLLPIVGITSDLRLSLAIVALVTWWIGSFVLCFGILAFRKLLFPLCFLYCMVPLPEFAVNAIIKYLQIGSALVSKSLFAIAGVPVMQNGTILSIPGLTVEIAKECSSIRSSLFLVITSLVLAQLFLRSPFRKALVVAIAVPLSVVKNAVRVFTLAMLATRVDPSFLTGRLHHQGGVVFFAASLLVILAVLKILERGERNTSTKLSLNAAASH